MRIRGAMSFVAALALLVAAALPAAARKAPTIDDAAWLAGRWIGEGLGGTIEETWAPPAGGQMVGHFRLVRDGNPVFYEILLIDVDEGGIRMRVKHFNPDFVGWEERDGWHTFQPDAASEQRLDFQGLSLQRKDADTLEIRLAMRYGDERREEVLTLRRAPL